MGHWDPVAKKTYVSVYYLNQSEKDFTFPIDGRAHSGALQGNVLAIHTFLEKPGEGGDNYVVLADINKRVAQSFWDESVPTAVREHSNALLWGGDKLYLFKRSNPFSPRVTVEEWDWSQTTTQEKD